MSLKADAQEGEHKQVNSVKAWLGRGIILYNNNLIVIR